MRFFVALAILVFAPQVLRSNDVLIREPAGDKWMYWQGQGGTRSSASVYGAYGSFDYISNGYDFDDRHAQMLLDFDTTALAQPGRGAGNYTVNSVVLTVVVNEDLQFFYDPTHDPLATYRGTQDSDKGRPLELFGVGYRGGWTLATFRENSPYQAGNATGYKNVRNAFAMDFVGGQARDVSNNVEQNFEVSPWAVGRITGNLADSGAFIANPLPAGSRVPFESVVEFTVNLSNPLVRAYVQQGLHAGRLQFMVTSLLEYTYTGDEGAGGSFPSFYTKESLFHEPSRGICLAAQLKGNVAIQSALAHRPEVSIAPANANGMRLRFSSQTGHSYRVQFRDSLESGSWTNLGSALAGTGNALEFLDTPPAGTPQRFYRVFSARTQP